VSQNKKKTIAIWNRRLAWITLVVMVVMNISTYADYFKWIDGLKTTSIVSSTVFLLLFLIHSFFSVFLFGFPKFKWQIRVVHIYIGYCLFIFTLLSQSLISFEPYHIILFTLMWISIVAHVALSIRFAIARNVKKQPEPSLTFRGEK
jgi:predicted MFS family arabinose efflux permease